MLVLRKNFEEIVTKLSQTGKYGADTETTGLNRSTDSLFSVIVADEEQGYYFNFQQYADLPEEQILPRAWIQKLAPIFANPESTFYIHNAKFDIWVLAKEGIEILGAVHCTEAMARVQRNNYFAHKPYSLAACAERIGLAKDDAVETYIKKNGLITKFAIPGKKKLGEKWHFDKVPAGIVIPYGVNDAVLHRKLGLHQEGAWAQLDAYAPGAPSILQVVENEKRLTKTCARMESAGIRINRQYVQDALTYEQNCAQKAQAEFQQLTGVKFLDSGKVLAEAFTKLGEKFPVTAKGNPSFNADALEEMNSPVARAVKKIRNHDKRAGTYYSSFLYFADGNGVLRANCRQAGTETGRVSYSDPNLQNVPKEDEEEDLKEPFLVRQSFIPMEDDECFVMIDFDQQEYRLMLDYAGEQEIIREVMSGMDLHQATANLMGVSRKIAKTLNFMLLYGGGVAKLAFNLDIPIEEAGELRRKYFSVLPRVMQFINGESKRGRDRGIVWNWFGRRCYLADHNFAYILPNHIIQGGCADIMKIAMNRIDDFLLREGLKSCIRAQIHDELLFGIRRNELHIVPELKKIMEGVYKPFNGLYLTCSVEHSWKSWGQRDKIEGMPGIA